MKNKSYVTLIITSLMAFSSLTTKASSSFLQKTPLITLSISITAAILLTSPKLRILCTYILPSFCFTNIFKRDDFTVKTLPLIPSGTITVNGLNHHKESDKLPTIYPSGIMKEIPITQCIKTVGIPSALAKVFIRDNEKPRIIIDQLFAQYIQLHVDTNGRLYLSTMDNASHKFAYNGNPLCIIYAKLSGDHLIAQSDTDITIENQFLRNIECYTNSRLQGSVKPVDTLRLNAFNNAQITLTRVEAHTLKVRSYSNAMITAAGTSENQVITIENNCVYDGSHLITGGGTIIASIVNNSQAFTNGSAKKQTITVLSNARYNGSNTIAQETTVDVTNNSTALIRTTNTLKGISKNNSTVLYTGNPNNTVVCGWAGRCLHNIIPYSNTIIEKIRYIFSSNSKISNQHTQKQNIYL